MTTTEAAMITTETVTNRRSAAETIGAGLKTATGIGINGIVQIGMMIDWESKTAEIEIETAIGAKTVLREEVITEVAREAVLAKATDHTTGVIIEATAVAETKTRAMNRTFTHQDLTDEHPVLVIKIKVRQSLVATRTAQENLVLTKFPLFNPATRSLALILKSAKYGLETYRKM